MEENIVEEKKKSNVGLIVFLVLIILGLAGYICYDKFFAKDVKPTQGQKEKQKEETKESNEKDSNENNPEDNIKGTWNISDLDKIMPSMVDVALDCVGFRSNLYSRTIDYAVENMDTDNLLIYPKFKFSLAFYLGMQNNEDLYVVDNESAGGYYITMDNYKIVYKNIYGENYDSDSIPEGTNFKMTDKGIFGFIYTGYGEPINFEKVNSESGEYLAAIKVLDEDKLPSEEHTIGHMKIVYNIQSDGKIAIKEFWLTDNNLN